ncbi:helix-turn-helix domain-containing protein [Leptospira sp. WS39.C2]
MDLIPFVGAVVSFLLFLSQLIFTYRTRKEQKQMILYGNQSLHNTKFQESVSRFFDYSAALLFLSLFILQFHIYIEFSNGFRFFTFLYGIHVPILFTIGPLCFLYFQKLSGGRSKNINRFHFFPSVLVLFLVFLIRCFEFYSIPNLNHSQNPLFLLLGLGVVSVFIYQSYFLTILYIWNQKFKESLKHSFLPFCVLVTYTFVVSLFFVYAQLFYMPLFLLACFFLLLLLVLIFVLNANRLELIPKFEKETSFVRYQESRLKGIDVEETIVRLEQLMRVEQLYLNEGLTLSNLAKHLHINSHQLSEFLNSHLGISFRNFTNQYRLEYAAKLLKEKPSMSIMNIIYASGFNSKSSFHLLFQKYFGVSPQNYRNQFK